MSNYIGAPYTNLVSPNFVKEDFNGDGSTVDFTLTNEVPGGNEENLYVVLDNVVQEPTAAFSIEQNGSSEYKVLRFTEAPSSTAEIYVVHRGIGTINTAPVNASFSAAVPLRNCTCFAIYETLPKSKLESKEPVTRPQSSPVASLALVIAPS